MRVEDKVILLLTRSSRRPGFRGASPITMSGVFSHEKQETKYKIRCFIMASRGTEVMEKVCMKKIVQSLI